MKDIKGCDILVSSNGLVLKCEELTLPTIKDRRYDVIAINDHTGTTVKLNYKPMSHGQAVSFKSRFTHHKARRLSLVEVTN